MFGQIINAVVTPFKEDGTIDYESFKSLLQAVEENHESIVIAGSTGEGLSLTNDEKKELVNFCHKNSKLKIILGISESNTQKVIEEVKIFSSLPIAAFLIATPSYYLPPQRGLYLHFKAISDESKNIPIILYNVPKRTGCSLKYITIRKLIASCPNIIGLKEATNDLNLIEMLKTNYPSFLVYTGSDSNLYEAISRGADGIISVMSICYGKLMHVLINDFKYGFRNVLLDDYLKIISNLMTIESNPAPIKYLLSRKGYKSMNLRLPLTDLSIEGKEQMEILEN